jgi:hypothetical protein
VSKETPAPERIQPYIDPDRVLAAVIPLFARVPGLLQKLLDNAAREVVADKAHPFFDDLFVAAPHPAVGANYYVVGYRLRNPNEWNFMDGTLDPDLANLSDHNVSPEELSDATIDAGLMAFNDRVAERVSLGTLKVFPPNLIQELASDLGRSLDCYVPTTECEAAVVRFALALEKAGWRLRLSEIDLQDSRS